MLKLRHQPNAALPWHDRFTWSRWGLLLIHFVAGSYCRAEDLAKSDVSSAVVAQSALLKVVDEVSVPARAAGVLALIQVDVGDVVTEGEFLAKVDDTEVDLIFQRATTEYELARDRAMNDVAIRARQKALTFSQAEYLRFKRAAEGIPGSISKSELEQSQVSVEQALLDLEQVQHEHQLATLTARLKRSELAVAKYHKQIHKIHAPIRGMVVEILRRRGEWVEPGEDVIRIVRIDRLRVEGLVAVEDVMQGLHGAEVRITVAVADKPKVQAKGRVVFVSPEINPVNGHMRVRAEFDNPAGQLMPGMRATMVIDPARR